MKINLFDKIKEIVAEKLQSQDDEAFFVFDVNNLIKQHQMWVKSIPRVKPFYAVKCNDSKIVLKVLAALGTGFDCASKQELQKILNLGVEPERIVFAHTTKQISHILFAKKVGVKKMTFDNFDEVMKIKMLFPDCQIILRIRFDAEKSQISFGKKFGCDPILEAPELIKVCAELKMNLIGISFHAGSNCEDKEIFQNALFTIKQLFDFALTLGFHLNFVDIGGGFIGNDEVLMEKYSRDINLGIEKYFDNESFEIIAEPGRYFVSSAFTLVCGVIARRCQQKLLDDQFTFDYYVNDGIFNSFLGKYLGKSLNKQTFQVLNTNEKDEQLYNSTVWGQTCDILDVLAEDILLPKLFIGDWLVVRNMGSYTISTHVDFNGFQKHKICSVVIDS